MIHYVNQGTWYGDMHGVKVIVHHTNQSGMFIYTGSRLW